jgi:hypothetical protein
VLCIVSGFHRGVNEILDCLALENEIVSLPETSITNNISCVTSQKSEVLRKCTLQSYSSFMHCRKSETKPAVSENLNEVSADSHDQEI